MHDKQTDLARIRDAFRRARGADLGGVPYCPMVGRRCGGERSRRMDRRRDLLTALCRELQRDAGDRTFTLKVKTVGEFFEIDTTRAWMLVRNLVRARIIKNVSPKILKRKGSEYRYLHNV